MNTESKIALHDNLLPDLYASIFKQTAVSMAVLNKDFLLIDVNPACLKLFEASGISDLQNISPFTVNSISEQTRATLLRGETVQLTHISVLTSSDIANSYPSTKNIPKAVSLEIHPLFDKSKKKQVSSI